ncbi:XdhC family protein [Spongiibacter sp. KMU-158]|uniref:XdhC family protein n=1 Tax=Spongiibacter pelagi TaxID=2760804 RepID=A0A927GW34_9GAMM|nr:XdhC family protein [Spongiibacter pelagi]MBD2859040.1 XdhC family protein [Spongiibacter pelagi]
MESSEQRVLQAVNASLIAGKSGWLVTIAATHGASPRPLGSLMWLEQGGAVWGSVSGGCIEDDLLEKLQAGQLATRACQLVEYGVSPEENERFGLPCGGRMKLLLEFLSPSKQSDIETLLKALSERQGIRRWVDLAGSSWQFETIDRGDDVQLTENSLRQDFGPRYQLLLIGANELARCIAEIATALEYRVLVCDPREERCQQWAVANTEIIQLMPDEAVMQFAADRYSAVITLTHDPRIDDMALMQALTHDLFYVGALGSVRTTEKRCARLLQLGLSDAQIARLHAPVGLSIGSKSAMEIAVAVMAELTALRRGKAEIVWRQSESSGINQS